MAVYNKEQRKEALLLELECHICLDYYEKPIRQCIIGHSFCQKCIDPRFVKSCPECRSVITESRNYALEKIISNMDFPCENSNAGCRYKLSKQQMESHQLECQYRVLKCEGQNLKLWNCNWEGRDIYDHFKNKHPEKTLLQFNSYITITYNAINNRDDIHIISAFYQLFWYRHRIDVNKNKAYWTFQLIGPKSRATNFYYEFEFYVDTPSIKKYKITEYCFSDTHDTQKIFDSEKCVAISLTALKQFVNEKNEYNLRYRIMKTKKESIMPAGSKINLTGPYRPKTYR